MCSAATTAVLLAVAGKNGTVLSIELDRGVFCPTPGLLFAGTTCPGGSLPPPEGGQWIGSALVTFAGSPAQAYLNVARDGGTYRGDLIALTTAPPPTPTPFADRCLATDLRAKTGSSGETGVVHIDVVLTNVGTEPCTLNGAPLSVELVRADGSVLKTDLIAPEPTTYEPVVLAPGVAGAARLTVYWENWCGTPPGPLKLHIALAAGGGSITVRREGPLVARCDNPDGPSGLQTEGFLAGDP